MKHYLVADSIELSQGFRTILSDIYIECETGKVTILLGRNGAGKSCLMNLVYGTLQSTNKSIRFDGTAVLRAYKKPELIRYLPQFNFIPEFFTVKQIFSDFDVSYDEFSKCFTEFKGKYFIKFGQLSGGEKRLVEVFVILKSKTKFILLDEPFSQLMPIHIEKLKEMINLEKEKKGIIVTDHLYNDCLSVSDKIFILTSGITYHAKNIHEIEKYGCLPSVKE